MTLGENFILPPRIEVDKLSIISFQRNSFKNT